MGPPSKFVTGNVYDKYGTTNPVARRLMAGFEAALDELLNLAAPTSLLDVGCGEGILTERWSARVERVVGIDLDDPALRAQWAQRSGPQFVTGGATELPFADNEFETVTAIEVLEHVDAPAVAFAELARVASRHVLVSVPREPLWRATNLARGAYVRDLGNTPGHVNHWSRPAFTRLGAQFGTIVESRSPFPWTMLLLQTPEAGGLPPSPG